LKPDDGEPTIGEVEPGAFEVAVFVRAAVVDRLSHCEHDARPWLPLAAHIEHPRDPAHELAS
jgi:hypothetical protein